MTQLAQSRKLKKGPSALWYIWVASTEILFGKAQAVTLESGQLGCLQAEPSLGLFSQGFGAAKHRVQPLSTTGSILMILCKWPNCHRTSQLLLSQV